ncbi:NAD(P)H-hydrate dehydratase [Vallicoccus soli]|uniref:ADP-dependent (S)-NAD(P)H-hydrate dehydratase n=1 Tax=Vallicoccus soli TaxID=2339232 RepID=A0A3A3ZKE3_9ACTN|nr:NAD(P)H-hydrate dehydratase [Vallicoccus soli]RJK96300.1 NAD(P)H-hydrate dehydratase [Vallicoccus soli]
MPEPSPSPVVVTPGLLRERWPLPEPGSDKESRGRTLVIGGSTSTPGAVLLAAEAALRAGAGKLQVATTASTAVALGVALPEAMVLGLPEAGDGGLDPAGADRVGELVEQASAVLVGPGATGPDATRELVVALLPRVRGALVLDALGLVAVTADPDCLAELSGRVVLTPNVRELALTLQRGEDEVGEDPLGAALELARRSGAVVATGGGTSYTARPDGACWQDDTGGGGLGVSGSGDVMAGIVTGLAARGADPAQAAVWAQHVHGRCGDRLAAAVGHLGFLARELPPEVPRVLAELGG